MTRPVDIPPSIYEWAGIHCAAHAGLDQVEIVARAFMAGQASVAAPDRGGLTDRQRQVLHILEEQVDMTGGTPPSIREIASSMGITLSRAHSVVKQLERRGLITMLPRRPRSITIVGRAAYMGDVSRVIDASKSPGDRRAEHWARAVLASRQALADIRQERDVSTAHKISMEA